MLVREWLLSKVVNLKRNPGYSPFLEEVPTVLERISELVYVNGAKWEIESYGSVVIGMGAYSRIGLNTSEAFELNYYMGKLDGLFIAHRTGDDEKKVLLGLVQKEICRCEECFTRMMRDVEDRIAKGWTAIPATPEQGFGKFKSPEGLECTLTEMLRLS